VLILALSQDAFRRADAAFPARHGCMVIPPEHVAGAFLAPEPLHFLITVVRKRLSKLRLNPFDILTAPDSNMFFGRQIELEILTQSESTSYAMAGPGRIGKTSLIQQFARNLRRDDRARHRRTVIVDFMNCDNLSAEGICQFLAISINDGRRARELKPAKIEGFLRKEAGIRGGPLELLLDEVDRVCTSETFRYLAEATRNKYCRIVLCGKGELYEQMNDLESVLRRRLRSFRLPPLSEEEAQNLFTEPLRDLGFELSEPKRLIEEVLKDTGRFANLIQFYGGGLVEQAVAQGTDKITMELLETIREDYETAQMFADPLLRLKNVTCEWIALALLHQQQTTFTEQDVRHVARREGLPLDEKEISRICRELYINNILLWDHDHYHIVNRALSRYARKLGYFAPRLAELRKQGGRYGDSRRTNA
jgi:GTPase SAR1 family protein